MSNEIEGQQQDTKKVSRRNVLKAAVAAGGAAALGFPMIAKAQQTITFKMQSTWPTKDDLMLRCCLAGSTTVGVRNSITS